MIAGNFQKTFFDANLAFVRDVPPDMDYHYRLLAVLKVERGRVTLAGNGHKANLPIKCDHEGMEYVELAQRSSWERAAGLPPTVFRVVPFSGQQV